MSAQPQKQKDISKEIEKYQKALEESPGSRYFAPLAEALRKNGQLDQARQIAEKGVALHPNYLSGIVVYAHILKDLKMLPESKDLFEKAIRINPENIPARKGLAEIFDAMGDHREALNAYNLLTLLDPTDANARSRLEILQATAPKNAANKDEDKAGAVETKKTAGEEEQSEDTNSIVGRNVDVIGAPDNADEKQVISSDEITGGVYPPSVDLITKEEGKNEEPEAESSSSAVDDFFIPASIKAIKAGVKDSNDEIKKSTPAEQSWDEYEEATNELLPSAEKESPPPFPFEQLSEGQDVDRSGLAASPDEESETQLIEPIKAAAVSDPVIPKTAVNQVIEEPGAALDQPKRQAGKDDEKDAAESKMLDDFFAGATLNHLEKTDQDSGFVVRSAGEVFYDKAEHGPDDRPEASTAFDFEITQSLAGSLFWNQGHFEKALKIMAYEVLATPDNRLLGKEFQKACKILEIDPYLVLDQAIKEQDAASQPRRDAKDTPPAAASDLKKKAVKEEIRPTKDGGDKDRAQALRTYLGKIKKDKEK